MKIWLEVISWEKKKGKEAIIFKIDFGQKFMDQNIADDLSRTPKIHSQFNLCFIMVCILIFLFASSYSQGYSKL